MLIRRLAGTALAIVAISIVGCQPKALTPTELEAVRTARDTYMAYERGDCEIVLELANEDALEVWVFNEMRHSMLLVNGFCRELGGDVEAARGIYRRLIAEAPNSFAADDAAERMRLLKIAEEDPAFSRLADEARKRDKRDIPKRIPVDRIPVEFPPLAKAIGVEGYAVVAFGVTQRGDTQNPIVVESNPPLLFDGASLRAIRRWQYLRQSSAHGTDWQLIRLRFKRDGQQESSDTDPEPVSGLQ